jgi:ketosteroid isomerase-like protein
VVARTEDDTDWSLLAGVDRGAAATAHLYSMEQFGSCVLASGSVRIARNGGFSESTMWWLFRFRDGRLARIERYQQAEKALAAAQAHEP